MKLRVHGFFQSRDYHETLVEFIGKAHKVSRQEGFTVELKSTDLMVYQIQVERNMVEIVARRMNIEDDSIELPHSPGGRLLKPSAGMTASLSRPVNPIDLTG